MQVLALASRSRELRTLMEAGAAPSWPPASCFYLLRYATPCYAMLCRAVPCHAMPYHDLPCRAVPRRAALRCAALRCPALRCAVLHVTPRNVSLHYIMLRIRILCSSLVVLVDVVHAMRYTP